MKLLNSYGRVIALSGSTLTLQNETGKICLEIENTNKEQMPRVGDIVEVVRKEVRILTRSYSQKHSWLNRTLNPKRLHGTDVRAKTESGIRQFFLEQGFKETRTPILVPCPGMEPHIRPFRVQSSIPDQPTYYLPTSPEFAMKRLLVGGLEKIFQITHSFRDEPMSPCHRPEFTMLEWYRAYSGFDKIMEDTENLFHFLALKIRSDSSIQYQGETISFQPPWPRLKVRDLFKERVGVDLVQKHNSALLASECRRLGLQASADENWDDLYFKIWLNLIEPTLPRNQAVFVTHYPPSQAALAVVEKDSDGSPWAKRFEVYAGGLELGNAFEELTDPHEQRRRFVEDMELREKTYGDSFPKNPIDEEFLDALEEGMPPCGGIAIGVDRLVMLLANESDINYTFWL